jgi:hypothetical protein
VSLVQAFAHLPFVGIEAAPTPIAEGELVRLGFDEWSALDTNFPFADRAYERSQPLFFQVDIDFGDEESSLDEAVEVMARLTGRLHDAIVLVTAARIPAPALSVTYHRDAETGASATTIGPFEREVLLYGGEERLELDDEELDRIRAAAAFLAANDELVSVPEIAAGLAALERTARPEVTPLSSLVLEVGALEALLMPEARTHLTATFARRAAALLADEDDELRPLHKRARRWYQARSEVLHGGELGRATAGVDLAPDEFRFDVRRGLVSALGAALEWLAAEPDRELTQLRGALDARWEGVS